MNQMLTTGVFLVLCLQLIAIKSADSTIIGPYVHACSSVVRGQDWTGERLKLVLYSGYDLDCKAIELGINFTSYSSLAKFTCGRRIETTVHGGEISMNYAVDKVKLINSSLYLNDDARWCNWTIYREDNSIFPLGLLEPAKLNVTPSAYQVVIDLNATLPSGQANVNLLPDNLVKKFKDYQLVGNSRYYLFTKTAGGRVNFSLVVNYEDKIKPLFPRNVTIDLIESPYGFSIKCDFTSSMVTGQLMFAGKPFWNDLTNSTDFKQLTNNQIVNSTICQWSMPNQINYGSSNGYAIISSSSFDLSIVADKRFKFYSQSAFKLTSSTTRLTSIFANPLIITPLLIAINKLFT